VFAVGDYQDYGFLDSLGDVFEAGGLGVLGVADWDALFFEQGADVGGF